MELLIYLGKSAIVLALFYTVYFLLLRKDTLFNAKRQFLIVGSITSVLLPMVEFTKVTYREIPEIMSLTVSNTAPATYAIQQNEEIAIYWWQIIAILYFTGLAVMAFRFLGQLISLLRITSIFASEKIDGCNHIKVSTNVSPFSFFNYVVYNPSLHSKEELKMILQHERVHALQWHTLDILLANLILIFQWMNPFAWLYKKSIEENLEFIADNETAQHVASKKAYQLALVKASSTFSTPLPTNNFYQSFIKKRIIMLNKSTSKKVNVWKLSIILPLLAIFLWSFNVKEVVEYKTAPLEISSSEKIERPDNENPEASEVVEKKKTKKESNTLAISKPEAFSTHPLPSETKKREVVSHSDTILQGDEVYILITKNTTEEDLKIHKKKLKEEHNIDFEYSNLKYNSSGEITSIAIKFSDNKGANGNYHVSEDGPIEDFYFYLSEDGLVGFGSEAMEERRAERAKRNAERMENRVKILNKMKEERRVEREKRRKDMSKRMERKQIRIKEMQKRNKERAEEIENRVYAVISNGDRVDEDDVYVLEDGEVYAVSDDVYDVDENVIFIDDVSSDDDVEVIFTDSLESHKKTLIITKDMTNAELDALKRKLAAENITFSYRNVKRNSNGEITGIKIKLNNNKGSESVSNIKSNGKPISPIHLSID